MYVLLLIIKSIVGMALMMLGVITFIHSGDHQSLGVLILFGGLVIFWSGLPSVDQNERLRRYERQHQKWLRK
jgi:uncharacterized membrane protein